MADDARLEMITQKLDPERVKGRANSRNLIEDIDAISILLEHPLQTRDLSGDAAETGFEFAQDYCFHPASLYPYRVYVQTAHSLFEQARIRNAGATLAFFILGRRIAGSLLLPQVCALHLAELAPLCFDHTVGQLAHLRIGNVRAFTR